MTNFKVSAFAYIIKVSIQTGIFYNKCMWGKIGTCVAVHLTEGVCLKQVYTWLSYGFSFNFILVCSVFVTCVGFFNPLDQIKLPSCGTHP